MKTYLEPYYNPKHMLSLERLLICDQLKWVYSFLDVS